MTIRAVFRVQCDGPCKGWLLSYTTAAGTEPAAARFPGERAARTAALGAGWQRSPLDPARLKWLCPDCKSNPLGIVLPPEPACSDPEIGHVANFNGRCALCDRRMEDE